MLLAMKSKSNPKGNVFYKLCLLPLGACSVVSLNFLDPINWPKQIALLTILPYAFLESLRLSDFDRRLKKSLFVILGISLTLFGLAAFLGTESLTRILWGLGVETMD